MVTRGKLVKLLTLALLLGHCQPLAAQCSSKPELSTKQLLALQEAITKASQLNEIPEEALEPLRAYISDKTKERLFMGVGITAGVTVLCLLFWGIYCLAKHDDQIRREREAARLEAIRAREIIEAGLPLGEQAAHVRNRIHLLETRFEQLNNDTDQRFARVVRDLDAQLLALTQRLRRMEAGRN